MILLSLQIIHCVSDDEAKISALSSSKMDKNEYLTGEEILPIQHMITEESKFTYSLLGNGLDKQLKTIEEQEEKQRKIIEQQRRQ